MKSLKTARSLDLLTMPLHGSCLIEASAGTGKTYTIAAIYLRLLLGIGGKSAFPRLLGIEEILMVTFTEAATEELRGRVRENINQLRLACIRGKSEDPLIATLLEQIEDHRLAALHLLTAERRMDEAAIFTIHGFCQHVLNHSVVESGLLFRQKILEDETSLRQQVSDDFWRRHCYPLPLEVARIVQQYWKGPENLLAELQPYLQGEPPEILDLPLLNESILVRHARIIASIEELKRQWRAAALEIPAIFNSHKLDRKVYNSKNLSTWLNKINRWAEQTTVDYQVPDELERFTSAFLAEKTIAGDPPYHTIFAAVQYYYQHRVSLHDLIFVMALTEMRLAIEQEKRRRGELGFDDLLSRLDKALAEQSGEDLAESLRLRYPVAMIDEFQDTDPQQYRIFRRVYGGKTGCALLLIGDPKQAIYAFRGADIFTYMRARYEVDSLYTLDTNWRSSPGMVNAVNHLFQSSPKPFVFSSIPFFPAVSAERNVNLRLIVERRIQPALILRIQPESSVRVSEYQQCMAQQCASTISNWLHASRKGEAWLEDHYGRQPLQASDIAVLVRNRQEAALMRYALATLMIPASHLSNQDSVFDTLEARELLWILQAVLMPGKNSALRTALATNLLGFDAASIEALNKDENRWEQLVEEFFCYRQQWQKIGVLPMLRQMMVNYCIAESLLASQTGGERRLTDVLHLGELLQETSVHLKSEQALVHWLALQIASPNPQSTNQQLRLESDRPLVQIITIHKSKGLEFPLVFLPFAADFRTQRQPLFHDRETYKSWLDLRATQKSMQLAEEERLSEDLRLLYVAVTRSIYHCSIGIAPLYRNVCKKTGDTDLHISALTYLIHQGHNDNLNNLRERLVTLANGSNGDIVLCKAHPVSAQIFAPIAKEPTQILSARRKPKRPYDPWVVTSYSELQRYSCPNNIIELNPNLAISTLEIINNLERGSKQHKILQMTPHNFPRGAAQGTFLHGLFKSLDFNRPLDSQWLSEQLTQQGIDVAWLPVIIRWIEKIISMPLDNNGSLSLTQLKSDGRQTEMQFYLPINSLIQASDLDRICKRYDTLSARCPPLDFPRIRGMLKGFIDLVFLWQGRYYLLDYKSNWLGEDSNSYTHQAMEQAMITHRYDLQYQLYTLALHRYLRHRLVDYRYSRDFGGVYYLFLRGVDDIRPRNGILHYCPNKILIDRLDELFSGAIPIEMTERK